MFPVPVHRSGPCFVGVPEVVCSSTLKPLPRCLFWAHINKVASESIRFNGAAMVNLLSMAYIKACPGPIVSVHGVPLPLLIMNITE